MTDFLATDGHDVTDEGHRADCAECTVVWTDLERIGAEARELPRLTPTRDLWSGIEARIADGAPGRPGRSDGRGGGKLHRFASHPAVRLATAASLLVAATASVTWTIATRGAPAEPHDQLTPVTVAAVSLPALTNDQLEEAFGVPTAVVARVQQASLDEAVAAMDREIEGLEKLLEERRDALDPRTIAVLEASMQLIDTAIAESRRALAADPASRFLATRYTRAYTTKLTLLRDAATLPTGD